MGMDVGGSRGQYVAIASWKGAVGKNRSNAREIIVSPQFSLQK